MSDTEQAILDELAYKDGATADHMTTVLGWSRPASCESTMLAMCATGLLRRDGAGMFWLVKKTGDAT
jgi:hypothetical protein